MNATGVRKNQTNGFDDDDWEDKSPNIPDYYNDDFNLIAAAPEMYEALKAVFEMSNDSNANPHDLLAKISQIAEDAVKKTEQC